MQKGAYHQTEGYICLGEHIGAVWGVGKDVIRSNGIEDHLQLEPDESMLEAQVISSCSALDIWHSSSDETHRAMHHL